MTNTEKMADLENRQREIADKIKAIRERVDFTLDGFLRGDFAVTFEKDRDKGMFLGWIAPQTNIVWGNGHKLTEFWADGDAFIVQDGTLRQGCTLKPKITFTPYMLSSYPSNAPAELHTLETEQRQIADEMAALKKEMEKPEGYRKPENGAKYYYVEMDYEDIITDCNTWENDAVDRGYYNQGNYYPTEAEAQRVADMLNYFFLVQRKAREMGGLLGYAHDNELGEPYVLVYNNYDKFNIARVTFHVNAPPLQPILTCNCAETLAKDPEIITAAKKAWGVK